MPSFPDQPPPPRPLLPAAAEESPRLTARTLDGLEWLLAAELELVGATELRVGRRTVEFSGSTETLYRSVLESRTAIRVLEPLGRFAVDSPDSLYRAVASIDWPAQLKPTQTLRVDAVVHDSFVSHSLYAAQVVKDAVVDRLRAATGRRPNVQLHGASLRLALHLSGGTATLFRDAAGQSLHQRGWRQGKVEAPLSEVLAAGILGLAGWQPGEPILDPFCGSGTLVIEAATQAAGIAPGLLRARRKGHGFFRFADCDRQLAARIVAELEARVSQPVGSFHASDLDPAAVAAARESAAAAGLSEFIIIEQRHFEEVVPGTEPGLVVTNPPYGERLPVARAAAIFRRLGDWLKFHCGGWRAAVLAPATTAKAIGLKPHRRLPLANGPIDCRLVELFLRQRSEPPQRLVEAEQGAIRADAPQPVDHLSVSRTVADQLGDFRRRLAKRARHLGRWARRQGIEAYRLYDRDIPEIPLVIDCYGDHLHVAEYERPHDRTAIEHDVWLDRMVEAAAAELSVPIDRVFLKTRRRQRARGQYEKVDDRQATFTVAEGDLQFEVNLSDYLDTGLFLDHRSTRALVRGEAAGRRLLNLFCYTGSFSVAAAAGNATTTTSLDLSNTYLDWTRRNLTANGFTDRRRHDLVRDDARAFLEHRFRRGDSPFDLVVVDPPTYSRSAKAATDWDVQRDHADLLELVANNLTTDGVVYFSVNFRRFKLEEERLAQRYALREITRQTIPEDFRNARIHRAWRLVNRS